MPAVPLGVIDAQTWSTSLLPSDDDSSFVVPGLGSVEVPAVLKPLSAFVRLANRFVAATAMTANATLIAEQLGLNTTAWMMASASAVRCCRLVAAQLVEEVLQDAVRHQEAAHRHLLLSVLLAILLLALLYALLVVCYGERVRRVLLLQTAESAVKSQTVRYLSHEARGCSTAALLAAGLLEDTIRDRSLGAPAGDGTAARAATAAPPTRAGAPAGGFAALSSPRDVEQPSPDPGDLHLLAIIKDALQQQLQVFTDALDWEKLGSGGFALEMQPTAIVDCVDSVVRMHVSVLCAGGESWRVREALSWCRRN
jgi:signal transduction histidine kinase